MFFKKKEKTQKSKLHKELERVDLKIMGVLLVLCAFGFIMLYSASSYECSTSAEYNYDSLYYVKRQAVYFVIGIGILLIARAFNYRRLCSLFAYIIYGFGLVSLIGLIWFGKTVNGATRWLVLGPVQFQVADVVKICLIIGMAYFIYTHADNLDKLRTNIYICLFCIIPVAMTFLLSDDLSSALVMAGMFFLTACVCSKKCGGFYFVVGIVLIAAAVVYVLSIYHDMPTVAEIETISFRKARIAAWLDPDKYASSTSYQVIQSLYAVASGGFFGKGLGNSYQKMDSIPESQNDMIFAIICEELGLFGAIIVLAFYACLIFYMVKVVFATKELFGSVLVMGVIFHIGLQALVNVAVSVNLIPNTGIGLPFISYGGTAMVCQLFEIGLVLSVERSTRMNAAHNIGRRLKNAGSRV